MQPLSQHNTVAFSSIAVILDYGGQTSCEQSQQKRTENVMDEWCRGNRDALNRKKTFIYPKKQTGIKSEHEG